MILTKTTIGDFLACEQKYNLSQIQGYAKRKPSRAMYIGTLLHKAKELFSLGKEPQQVVLELKKEIVIAFKEGWFEPDDCKVIETIAYHGAMNMPWPFLDGSEPEVQFMLPATELFRGCPFDDSVMIAGKIDEVIPLRDSVMLVDYKTRDSVSNVGTSWFSAVLALDMQQILYRTAYAKQFNVNVGEFEFRYIARPGIRQKKGESHDKYLARIALEYASSKNIDKYYASCRAPSHHMPRIIENIRSVFTRMNHRLLNNGWEMNPNSCIAYNKACPFLPLCNGEPGWSDLYEKVGPDHHPELEVNDEERERTKDSGEK